MNNKKRLLSIILTASLCATTMFSFTGCGKSAASDSGKSGKDKDQVLNLVMLEPQSLDASASADTTTSTIINETQEGLVRIKNTDGTDKIVPAGAKSWETSKDGLVWTFHLRDYKWSDGKKVTAQQYVDSIIRLLTPKNAFPYAFIAYDIKNAQAFNQGTKKAEDVGVKAVDDNKLQITLEKPVPYFLNKVAHSVFKPERLDIINAAGQNYDSDIKKQVYCGPYKIKDWVKNNSMTFVKNDSYWDAKNVPIETVNMKNIQEFATQAQLFESKQLDVTGSTQDYVKKWEKEASQGKFQFNKGDTPSVYYLAFNQKNKGPSGLMGNVNVRKAVTMAFDRDEYTSTISGRYSPAYGVVPKKVESGDKIYRDSAEEPIKDLAKQNKNKPEEIQKILHQGLKELGKDTTNLKSIKLQYMAAGTSALDKQEQEWWKQQLEKNLGVTVEVHVESDQKLFDQDKRAGKYDLWLDGWQGDYNDPITFLDYFQTGNGNNTFGYSDPEYDKLLASLDGVSDNSKRFEIYKQLEKKLVADDYAVAPLFYSDTRRFTQNYVKGFESTMFGSTYEWRWAYIEGK